ncbi:MAG: secondary thiamine-phosphate synthase enzyme YjbQ [bacterium]
METFPVRTQSRNQFVDITPVVRKIVKKSHVENGICTVFVMHTTAGITINENADPSVKSDILNKLEKLVPPDENYTHMEGNSDSHIKASLMGFEKTLIIHKGDLVLGTWQNIYFCEFDGPRSRNVCVQIVGS